MTDIFVPANVKAIGMTQSLPGFDDVQRETGWFQEYPNSDVESIIEFAGRGCYESWDRPNAATATNAGYIKHIMEVGHFSVIEHGVMSFYCRGLSRSLTHELVRHRHFSYSQLSQRYVDPGAGQSDTGPIQPPISWEDEIAEGILNTRQPKMTSQPDLRFSQLLFFGNFCQPKYALHQAVYSPDNPGAPKLRF